MCSCSTPQSYVKALKLLILNSLTGVTIVFIISCEYNQDVENVALKY